MNSSASSQFFVFKVFSFIAFLKHVTGTTLDLRNGYILTADRLPVETTLNPWLRDLAHREKWCNQSVDKWRAVTASRSALLAYQGEIKSLLLRPSKKKGKPTGTCFQQPLHIATLLIFFKKDARNIGSQTSQNQFVHAHSTSSRRCTEPMRVLTRQQKLTSVITRMATG